MALDSCALSLWLFYSLLPLQLSLLLCSSSCYQLLYFAYFCLGNSQGQGVTVPRVKDMNCAMAVSTQSIFRYFGVLGGLQMAKFTTDLTFGQLIMVMANIDGAKRFLQSVL